LAERQPHASRDDACERVRRSTGRERHHQRDLARRIGLCPCRSSCCYQRGGEKSDGTI
jgi:hypothetical protein